MHLDAWRLGLPSILSSLQNSLPAARACGSDATFEVPVPLPKRAKRAPTPSLTPPRAAAKPKAPASPFLPIKLP